MALTARRIEVENPMDARLARLEERTEHIQRDVAEIKGDIRRTDSRMDAFRSSVDTKLDTLKDTFNHKSDAVRNSLEAKVGALDGRLDDVKDSVTALTEKIGTSETSMIRWMIGTVIAAVTSAFAIAKFFS